MMRIRSVVQKIGLGSLPLIALIVFSPSRSSGAQSFLDPFIALTASVTGMGSLLSTMSSTMSGLQSMENTLIHPINDISNIQNNGSSIINSFRSWMNSVSHLNIASAQTSSAQSLEMVWLGGNNSSSANPQIYSQYAGTYGQNANSNAAPLPVRQTVDMSDTNAQDAIQMSILADSAANLSIQQANTLESQAMSTSAGSAPQIEATALAYELSDLAIEHRLYASQLLIIAARLANSSAPFKEGTTSSATGAGAIFGLKP
jgi:hypothetical protein